MVPEGGGFRLGAGVPGPPGQEVAPGRGLGFRLLGGGGARGEGGARGRGRFGLEEAGIVQGHDGIETADEHAEQGGEGEEEGRQQTVGFRPCDQTIG